MTQNERAQRIIQDFISIPKDRWISTMYGGQGVFEVSGHAGYALYFGETLLNRDSPEPDRDAALGEYYARLGERSYAVEVFNEDLECVCLLRWDDLEEIEVAEYIHGTWETVSFGLPPHDESLRPVLH